MEKIETQNEIPMVSIVGSKNMGKTTLVRGLISYWSGQGYRVGALKHAHHGFQMDRPTSDSGQFQQAGAVAVGVVGLNRVAFIEQINQDWNTQKILQQYFQLSSLDFILLEGFKSHHFPKIEVFRPGISDKHPLNLTETLALVTTADQASFVEEIPHPILPFDLPIVAAFLENL